MSTKPGRPSSRADRLFRALLRAFPVNFRTDHAREMEQTFRAQRRDAREEGSRTALVRLWLETVRDVAETGVDVISVGALTHSARVLDIGLDAVSN